MGNIEAVLKAFERVNILWIGNDFLKGMVGGEGRAEYLVPDSLFHDFPTLLGCLIMSSRVCFLICLFID